MSDGRGAKRVKIVLVCSECGARNYKTNKSPNATERLVLKKFCPSCRTHTEHRESRRLPEPESEVMS